MNLFDLSAKEQLWLDALTREDEDGNPISEDEQARIIDEYIAADADFKDKLDRYVELSKGFAMRASFREDQCSRLNELARRDKSVATKLEARLKAVMELRGDKRIETDLHELRICNNGGKAPLVVPDEWRRTPTSAPEEFHRHKIELDVNQIRTKLEAGESVPGCEIAERGTHLRIK